MDGEEAYRGDKALLIIDLQRDFMPGGACSVPAGDSIVARINDFIAAFVDKKLPVFASCQRHAPTEATSGRHPGCCLRGCEGAEFPLELHLPESAMIVARYPEAETDRLSVFDGAVGDIGFADMLRALGVRELFIGGLATDRSVRETVRDAREEGFSVSVLIDAVRGFEVIPGDSALAVADMVKAGARLTTLSKVCAAIGASHRAVYGQDGEGVPAKPLQEAKV
jgi:nicotinamidase/pyrazinamidase